VLFFAGAATAAGDVERHGHQIPDLQVFDVTALLDHLTGDFVAQYEADLGRRSATHHVLIGTTNVGGNHAQDHPVLDLLAARVLHLGIVDFLYFDLACAEIHHTTITRHAITSLLIVG
jgi:hypothetical protein